METIKFNYRFTLKPNGRVFVRVRWQKKQKELTFCLNVYAEESKWDTEAQRAVRNTSHTVKDKKYTAREINKEIEKAIDIITEFFAYHEHLGVIPEIAQLREVVDTRIVPPKKEKGCAPVDQPEELPSLDEIFKMFRADFGQENNWGETTHYKYQQILNILAAYKKDVTLLDINKQTMNGLKGWMVEQGYKNSTITKHFRYLKCILRWCKEHGYPVAEEIFGYKTNLSVPMKAVVYLKYEEVLKFENFKFPKNKEYLARARDYFCFMCYTSLRYSDLRGLKKASITDNCIDIYAQKTNGRLRIPLVSHAIRLYEKYRDTTPGEYLFRVPTNQKMNEFLKEAAQLAGLDREIIETSFCGTKRIEEVHKLYESISCHDARRTFVCISLSLGIPQSVVMTCTGHADYETMKPYIAISDETSKHELVKWEIGSIRNELHRLLDDMTEEQLSKMVKYAKESVLR